MGGPGSGGYKTAPGDVETHSAWEIIVQDPESTQVSSLPTSILVQADRCRNLPKYDASSVAERWPNTPLGKDSIYYNAKTTSWQ